MQTDFKPFEVHSKNAMRDMRESGPTTLNVRSRTVARRDARPAAPVRRNWNLSMPVRLLKFALSRRHPEPRMFTAHERLKSSYDVVIIGGGGHGLAAAYYLARDHGIRNVAVLEKGYLGGGNTGRNTTIIRSNYLTPEGVQFYDESVRLWQDLSQDFDLNLFYSTRGHYTLAHTDAAMRTMRWRAEVNKHLRGRERGRRRARRCGTRCR